MRAFASVLRAGRFLAAIAAGVERANLVLIIVALGHDPIWFGIILIKMCELANITPPIGLHAFVIKGIAPPGVQIESIFKGCSMFVVLDALTIALLVAYPEIVMWLPSTMD